MSPQGGRQAPGKGGAGNVPDRAAARRLGLLIFGASFVVLFAIVAIAEGVGNPSVPSDAVAVVEEAPGDSGEISEAEFQHALEQAAAQAGVKKVPKPGDPQYDELKETALNSLFEAIWLRGFADERGLTASEKEIDAELKKLKDESFQSPKEFRDFLKEAKYTRADVRERVELQVLSTKLQEQLQEGIPAPSQDEVESYYEAAKGTQFTQQPSRDVRLVVNKDRKKAQQARAALGKDNSEKKWKEVAKKYSEDPATKENGGLQQGVTEGTLEEPLNEAVFNAPEGQVEGPIDAQRGFTVFEVTNSNPEQVQELEAVEAQIQSTIAQQAEQEFFAALAGTFTNRWKARTFCDPDYLIERCANFKGDGHPATAPPGCYEANPDGGRPEACPAPVFQLVPAQPGSVTPLEPRGKPLTQRPRPVEGAEEAPGGATGLPEGAVPPPAEAPPAE